MEYRWLGASGFKVSALGFGAGTFGGKGPLFNAWGNQDEIAAESGKSVPQIAINWLLQRPTVATVLIGARNEQQLRENLGAVGWQLSADQIARLDRVSGLVPPYPYYPYWNGQFAERTPAPVPTNP